MAKLNNEDYRTTLLQLVKDFKKSEEGSIVELEGDHDLGKSFEAFCANNIYGPLLNIEEEFEDCYDLNSRGERNVDIIFNKDLECHIFECKWRNNEKGKFDKSWIDLLTGITDWIDDLTKIQAFPDYVKEKYLDFYKSKSTQKYLHVYLLTNTNVNDDQREEFKSKTSKISDEFKKFNIIFHLKNAAELYHDWAKCNQNELGSLSILKKDRETKTLDRVFKLKDKISDSNEVKETLFYIASGMEVKDWVDGNDNIFNDNIRGYLGANKVNKSMLKTIDENPEDFFTFNNGITAVTTEINENEDSFELEKFQIINGCQTATALQRYYKDVYKNSEGQTIPEQDKNENLRKVKVQVRIIETKSAKKGKTGTLIRANNTQNVIQDPDFRSTDLVQENIEFYVNSQRFKYKGDGVTKNTKYARKRQRIDKRKNEYVITLRKLAEYVYLFENDPVIPNMGKNKLFDDEVTNNKVGTYVKIFGKDNILVDKLQDDRVDQMIGICHLSEHIIKKVKEARLKIDKDTKEYLPYYSPTYFVSLIGWAAKEFLEPSFYSTLINQSLNGKLFEDNKKTKIDELIKTGAQHIRRVQRSYSKKNELPLIRNLLRQNDYWEDIKEEMKEDGTITIPLNSLFN